MKIVPTPESDSSVIYILNGKVLTTNFEADLSEINDKSFIELTIIDKNTLRKKYKILDKAFGVLIKATPKEKKD